MLEGRPATIDGVMAFAEGADEEIIDEEAAAQILVEQQQCKAQGIKYCNCNARTAIELLAKFGRIEP